MSSLTIECALLLRTPQQRLLMISKGQITPKIDNFRGGIWTLV